MKHHHPERPELPVVVVGAGPIGLAAAVHLLDRRQPVVVLEAGDAVAASIREWGHVRLFSPWKYLVDGPARARLEATGWRMPDGEALPTGRELVEQYLEPLAAVPEIAATVRLRQRVVAITRHGFDKVKSAGRDEAPFEVVVATPEGEDRLLARAVIDASGTWSSPNPLGASGLPARGEREHAARISNRIPDALGADRGRYAGKRTLVVGSGHSAFNALLDLAVLARQEPGTRVTWAVRRPEVGLMFGGGRRDALSARGSLGERLRDLVEGGGVELVLGFRASALSAASDGGLLVAGEAGRVLGPFDEIVVTTGFRPDLGVTRELRLSLDSWLESPTQLAPLVDPNVHSCGTVYPHGAAELAHPEKDFYVVGMKSYGRAPTFLLLTGYEQVRSVAAQLAGDVEAAREVQLVLPETGVCSTDLATTAGERAAAGGGGSCCGATAGEAPAAGVAIQGSCGIASPCASPAAASTAAVAAAGGLAARAAGGGCCG